jgi:7-keto-8-aminopelargonate synthetase-like enzyme
VVGVERALTAVELTVVGREILAARGKYVAETLQRQGWKVVGGTEVPILAVASESFKASVEIQQALLQRGILTEALPGKSRGRDGGFVRILVTLRHTDADLESLLESFSVVRERILLGGELSS